MALFFVYPPTGLYRTRLEKGGDASADLLAYIRHLGCRSLPLGEFKILVLVSKLKIPNIPNISNIQSIPNIPKFFAFLQQQNNLLKTNYRIC